MGKVWTDQFMFVSGAVRYKDLVYLIIVGDELAEAGVDHYYPTIWDKGIWGKAKNYRRFSWSGVSVCVCTYPIEQGAFLGAWGELFFFGSGDSHTEQIDCGDDSPKKRGQLRQIRSIGGKAYAVGMSRQVYRRDDRNLWTCIDRGAKPSAGLEPFAGFDAIDGFSESEIYAAGRNGEIWIYDGALWKQIASPTNRHLTNICCATNGRVYICGQGGILIEGRHDQWGILTNQQFQDDIWGLAWFRNSLYVSTRESLFILKDKNLEKVNIGKDNPSSCYHLSAADGVMWSIGPKDIMSFDGNTWTRIE